MMWPGTGSEPHAGWLGSDVFGYCVEILSFTFRFGRMRDITIYYVHDLREFRNVSFWQLVVTFYVRPRDFVIN